MGLFFVLVLLTTVTLAINFPDYHYGYPEGYGGLSSRAFLLYAVDLWSYPVRMAEAFNPNDPPMPLPERMVCSSFLSFLSLSL
jgi:hypothetical protein